MQSVDNFKCVVYIFDTGKIQSSFYGDVVFSKLIGGKEITHNTRKIVFSHGDLFNSNIYSDISPFMINDELCSLNKNERYDNILYGVLVEDIETKIAINIDQRMKDDFPAYIGMTTIDIKSTDLRKQFWKMLIRRYSIELETITIFGDKEHGFYLTEEEIKKQGFNLNYDGFDGYCNDETGYLFSTRQSSFIQAYTQLEMISGKNDSDRGLLEMNFSLVKEVNLAGVMIWKAIEDIHLAYIPHKNEIFADYATIEYIFMSLYQASQGVERLLKVAIQLIMYVDSDTSEKDEYEKHLHSHNHFALVDFIASKTDFDEIKSSKNFINLLQTFYKSARYHRFRYSEDNSPEIAMMQELCKDFGKDNFDEKAKLRYGKLLGKTAQATFSLIKRLSEELNIYIYELNFQTNAPYALLNYHGNNLYKTYMRIEQSKRELIWHLMANKLSPKLQKFASDFPPLAFDDAYNVNYLLKEVINGGCNGSLFSVVDHEYNELASKNKSAWQARIDFIKFVTSPWACAVDE
ncbi:MAG: hypothetical protein FWC71_07965 [Defluviitaleaceae bacterium]|nr:hypothetical protein [Defluviitaleaceae bacterium]